MTAREETKAFYSALAVVWIAPAALLFLIVMLALHILVPAFGPLRKFRSGDDGRNP